MYLAKRQQLQRQMTSLSAYKMTGQCVECNVGCACKFSCSVFFCLFWFCILHMGPMQKPVQIHKWSVKIGIKIKNRILRVAINQTVAAPMAQQTAKFVSWSEKINALCHNRPAVVDNQVDFFLYFFYAQINWWTCCVLSTTDVSLCAERWAVDEVLRCLFTIFWQDRRHGISCSIFHSFDEENGQFVCIWSDRRTHIILHRMPIKIRIMAARMCSEIGCAAHKSMWPKCQCIAETIIIINCNSQRK